IDTEPLQGEPGGQPAMDVEPNEKPEASAEDEFFSQDDSQQSKAASTEPEELLAVNLGDQAEVYVDANAAVRKQMLVKLSSGWGVTQSDMERLTSKGYGQWTKQDRIKLLEAYVRVATGDSPADVFPTS
ncbi:hypothetical protein, partial [Maridesulfovibrio ferrireducens]|uniref:hypothetical protein n=1 Tax=Maridesulfovibrio ferrireducens TaxID=246191 RepID=UPI001A20F69B